MANVSHEIRTPLNAILGFAEGIIQTDSIEIAHSHAKTILRESEHLLGLINQLLDHARIEAGQMDIERRPTDLSRLIQDIGCSARTLAREKDLLFHVSVDHDVPPFMQGDAARLRQVLMNLISNALKFTRSGSITLKVSLERVDNDRYIRFGVTDTGIGISTEKQALIFESFAQGGEENPAHKFSGVGLGISTSHQLVGLMGGHMGLESQPGKGSTFWFALPCNEQDIPAEADELSLVTENYDHEPNQAQPARILVVEDYPPNQDVMRMHLTGAGHTVDLAENGKLGVEACEKDSYDLILMDVQMPVMDGITAAKVIRAGSSPCQNAPIIALTANAEGDTQTACLGAGMNEVITKPVRRKALLNTLNKWLDVGTGQPAEIAFQPSPTTAPEPEQANDTGRKFILVAEDSELIQNTVYMRLSNAGYRVDIAENGQQALEMTEKTQYNLILMDVQMPEVNGLEATELIRARADASSRVPIVGLTADVEPDNVQTCLDAGMDDVVSKATRSKEFLAKVRTWMMRSEHTPEPGGSDTQDACAAAVPQEQGDESFDLEDAVREFGGNRELVVTIIEKFLDTAGTEIQTLNDALDQEDREALRKEAHRIRGGAANLTAMAMARVAEKLEKMAPGASVDELAEQVTCLEQEFDRLGQVMQ